jgi:hypothetical protein
MPGHRSNNTQNVSIKVITRLLFYFIVVITLTLSESHANKVKIERVKQISERKYQPTCQIILLHRKLIRSSISIARIPKSKQPCIYRLLTLAMSDKCLTDS